MNDTSESFLIDTNAIITPYLSYYPFDFAAKFWEQLENHIGDGSIVLLDMVKQEIEKGNDTLSEWIKDIHIAELIDHRNPQILDKYSDVLTHIQKADHYTDKALTEWSKFGVADPWLIATASACNYTIITFEQPSGGLSSKSPSGHPKIPDVCSAFNVKYKDLYYMMRQLCFTLG